MLPTYNEAGNLEQLLSELRAAFSESGMEMFRPYEIIFVDGGSTDGTRDIIREAALDDTVRAVFLRKKFGQSPALAAGFDAATGEFIVPMDADLQNDPADIPDLLDKLVVDGVDCVSGWRRDRDDPWHKTIPSAIQTRLAKLTGPDIEDFGCTLTAYRADALEDIDLHGEGHRYIPAKLHKLGYSVTEMEVNHRPRIHGQSRYGVGRLLRGFVDLFWHVFWVRWSSRPLHVFGGIGFGILGFGGLLGTWLLVENYLLGADLLPNLPQLLLSVGAVLFGLQVLVFGFVVEFLTTLYYRDNTEYRVEQTIE